MHDWWLALVCVDGRIEMLDSPKVRYRLHGNNQIGGAARPWGISGSWGSNRRALARVFRQNQELGTRLGDRLDPAVRSFIESIPRAVVDFDVRQKLAGVSPQGLARRIRFFIETVSGGYRRYLD